MKSDKNFRNVIWEGRFQPIHKGHISYIRTLLEYGEHLWIFVVDNERSDTALPPVKSAVPWFSEVVDSHHNQEKNPLPFWLRLRLVQETLREEFGSDAPITVWGGRRLDFQWEYYSKAFPPNRVFLTPQRDDFEDLKAKAWETLGETVIRIDVSHIPQISATMVRAAWNNPHELANLLHPHTLKLLRSYHDQSI
jgi:cytidyltransferase-like protein